MFKHLLELLRQYDWDNLLKRQKTIKKLANFRRNNLTTNVGYTRRLFARDNKIVKTRAMRQNKDVIYDECKRIFPDFDFNAVQINKNFKCDPHIDGVNVGESMTFSLGDFSGGRLFIEEDDNNIVSYNTKENPIIFNGSKKKHWVDDFEGERFAVVLFSIKDVPKFKIAIPSYQRVNELQNKTLSTLERGGCDMKDITIFVANQEEYDNYRDKIKNIKIEIGELGITNQRNFIKMHYKRKGTCVLVIDDDIERFERVNKETSKFEEITDLKKLFEYCFLTAKNNAVNLWGVYPAHNSLWMSRLKEEFKYGWTFCIGCCYGIIIEDDMTPYLMNEEAESKEDYEQSVLHCLYAGNVLRFNNITVKTKFYADGGLGSDKKERADKNEKAANYLISQYPEYFKKKIRKDGRTEVALINS